MTLAGVYPREGGGGDDNTVRLLRQRLRRFLAMTLKVREMKTKPMGVGLGLRAPHYPVITGAWPEVDWFEAVSENYMDTGGRPLQILEQVRRRYPVALHGTALSIGSSDPLNKKYLERLKRLVERIDPFIVSDHLCWSGVNGQVLHDLLPLPFTEEAIRHVVGRVEAVQEFLGRRILLENVSTYVTYPHSTMPEWEFLTQVARRAACGILLDLNNIFVNAVNHKFNPHDYLKNVPGELVEQFHLAGHTDMGTFLFDTHSTTIVEQVWDLYREALELWGPVSTLIEWDEDIPAFEVLAEEARKAKAVIARRSPSMNLRVNSATTKQSHRDCHAPPNTSALAMTVDSRRSLPPSSVGGGNDKVIQLSDIQEQMRTWIQPSKPGELGRRQVDSDKEWINPQGGVPGVERLSVYANGFTARAEEALSEVYEAVHAAVGDEAFSALCRDYAARFAASDYNLNFIGRDFPEFVESRGDPAGRPYPPFLADLARLEWRVWEAFHAFHKEPLAQRDIAGIPIEDWENARLLFQPSVSLVSSPWPVLDMWLARHRSPDSVQIDLKPRSQRILVGRKEDQVRCELLDENQFRLIEGLLAGQTLGAVCEQLAETLSSDEPLPIDAWFSRWIQDGLIAHCEFTEDSPHAVGR